MRNPLIAFCSLAAALIAGGSEPAEDIARPLAKAVLQAESVSIEFSFRSRNEAAVFSDRLWLAQLAQILENASYSPRSHCLCVSFPQIHLIRDNVKIGSLSVHHDEKLRIYVGDVSGDFFVGKEVGRALLALAKEKQPE